MHKEIMCYSINDIGKTASHFETNKIRSLPYIRASLVAQPVKNPLAVRETWVQSLGWEDTLEKGKAAVFCREGNGTPLQYSCPEHSMDGGAWLAAVHGVARVRHDWATSLSLFTFMHWRRKWQPTPVLLPGESQGQWAPVYGVAQSRTRLKWLSSSSSSILASRIPWTV